jgi:hypothetical protein
LRAEQEARIEESRKLQLSEQELQKRRLGALHGVKISETKIECYDLGSCWLNLAVTNGSREVVTGFSLGWMFPSIWDVSCPSELSAKEKKYETLRPGETTWVLVHAVDAPPQTTPTPKYCIRITSVDIKP